MSTNKYHSERNKELIKAVEKQQKNPIPFEQKVAQLKKRIKQGKNNKDSK